MDTYQILDEMFKANQELYLKILDTPQFAYWFNELCNKARKDDMAK